MKRTEFKRGSSSLRRSSLHRGGRINPVSKKRAKENRSYSVLRREFLEARPTCEMPTGCQNAASEVHHRKGRVGALLLDVTHWSALCHADHQWVTEHPSAAVALGISELRVGAA